MNKPLLKILSFALLVAVFFSLNGCTQDAQNSTESVPSVTTSSQPVEKEQSIQPSSSELSRLGMCELPLDAMAFRFFDTKCTLGEYLDFLRGMKLIERDKGATSPSMDEPRMNGLNETDQTVAREVVKGFFRQKCLLHLASKEGVTVSDEEKQAFMKRWLEANPGHSIQEYLNRFPEKTTSSFQISREDMFRLLKYTDSLVELVEVPEENLKAAKSQIHQIRQQGEAAEQERLEQFKKLSEREEFQTDEGFAELAREFSDGEEYLKGGLIAAHLTREEIAACNHGQPFDTPVGKSSELIETEGYFRYIRVLKEIPGAMAGEPPTLEIAQILFEKRELEDLPSDEEIEHNLKYQYQSEKVNEVIAELLKSGACECPLFPNLLDDIKVGK